MIWEVSDNLDWRVGDYTGWIDIQDYQEIENRSGIFVLVDCELQVKFIGYAERGNMKNAIARMLLKEKNLEISRIKVLYTNSSAYAELLIPILIKKYKPPFNTRDTKRMLIERNR